MPVRGKTMIHFDQGTCGNLDDALQREWLETNGLGGFASSTIVGLNTRRYHSLLVAATQPPVGRMAFLSKLEESLVVLDGAGLEHRFDLSANQYPGIVHPQGHRYLKQFRLDPFPIFTYEVEGISLEKAVFMVQGENTVCVQYKVTALKETLVSASLHIRPLIAFRDFHATTHENGALNAHVDVQPGLVTVQPYDSLPALHIAHNANAIDANGDWYRNFEYAVERERGLDFREDLFSPFALNVDLEVQQTLNIIASIQREAAHVSRIDEARTAEVERRRNIRRNAPSQDELVTELCAAADQFIVQRGSSPDNKTIIAGYPWFADWGRDTMIALPGLTLVTGKFDLAKVILRTFAQHLSRGMLPNHFPDSGKQPDDAEYNTVDATLWMIEATRALAQYSGDDAFVRSHLYEPLLDVIEWHKRGTRYNIHVDSDGLVFAGQPGVQLTWMDAKVGDWVVTPRIGKPVEIQALWFNALQIMSAFALKFGDTTRHNTLLKLADDVQRSFNQQFWNEDANCLYDVVGGMNNELRDAAIRPNQIFAVSLPYTMLPADKARRVVNTVQQALFTPFGLRSLSPNDPQYRGRYGGDVASRDGAYHQGTVWAWLMGPFITAYVKVHGGSQESHAQVKRWLDDFQTHLRDAGLGHVSELFDGDVPHKPGGCFAQAWSVAELLRSIALMPDTNNQITHPSPPHGIDTDG
jgi:predicted glycogen debranching enzyme